MRDRFIKKLVFPYEGKITTNRKPPIDVGDHTEQEITFLLDGRTLFQAFCLEPKRGEAGKRPAIVCFMGHGKVAQILRQADSYQHACAARTRQFEGHI